MAQSFVLLPDKPYNVPLLAEELRAKLGERTDGAKSNTVEGVRGMYAILQDSEPGDEAIAQDVASQHDSTKLSRREQVRADLLAGGQSIVGMKVDDLKSEHIMPLLALLLYRAGAVGADGTIKPLEKWVG